MSFCAWLISLSIISSSFSYVANYRIFFFLKQGLTVALASQVLGLLVCTTTLG
jgi:hypothetical protein